MEEHPPSQLSLEFTRLSADLLDQSMAKIRHCFDQIVENQVWWRPDPPMNSIGNLCVHLAGNLRQWGVVPFTLASDRRDRDSEFQNDIAFSADELLELLESATRDAKEQWGHLATGQLVRKVEIQGFDVTYLHAIVHASSHFVGHTHQIIQLTRIQLGSSYKFHWRPNEARGDLPI